MTTAIERLREQAAKAYDHARLLSGPEVLALLDVVESAIELRGAAGFPYDSGFDTALANLETLLNEK